MNNSINLVLAAGAVAGGLFLSTGCASACKPCPDTNRCSCGAACECPDCTCRGPEGRWTFTGFGSCWMGLDARSAYILWGGGSPVKQQDLEIVGSVATMRQMTRNAKNAADQRWRETTFVAKGLLGDLVFVTKDGTGKELERREAVARRLPPLPAAPDLAKLEFAEPIDLLAAGMDGWMPMGDSAKRHCGWTVKDGVLSNRIARKSDGSPVHGDLNLKTKRADFEDFKLSYDVRVLPGCNSGVYLRGIYELQVLDSYGKPVDCHNMAAFYGRITPAVAAEKPANEWQHVDAILCDRHITVTLNGVRIIDNAPIMGITGGAMSTDEFAPGPIYLQGDHSDADFRNIILTPIVKR